MSPANIPIFQFKTVIVAAGLLLFIQGLAQVFRCILCLRTGAWPVRLEDVVELEEVLIREHGKGVHATDADAAAPGEERGPR